MTFCHNVSEYESAICAKLGAVLTNTKRSILRLFSILSDDYFLMIICYTHVCCSVSMPETYGNTDGCTGFFFGEKNFPAFLVISCHDLPKVSHRIDKKFRI